MVPPRNIPDLSGVTIPGRLLPYYYFNSVRYRFVLRKMGIEIFWGDNLQYGPGLKDSFWRHFEEPPKFDNPAGLFVRLTKRDGEHPLIMHWHSPSLAFRKDAIPVIQEATLGKSCFHLLKLVYRKKIVFENEYHLLEFPYLPSPKIDKIVPDVNPGLMFVEVPGEKYYSVMPLHRFSKQVLENPPILFTEFGSICLSERLVLKLLELDPDLQFDPTYLPYEYM